MRNEEIMIPSLHSLMIKLTEVPLVRIATCNFPFRLIRQLTMVTLKLSYIYIYIYICNNMHNLRKHTSFV